MDEKEQKIFKIFKYEIKENIVLNIILIDKFTTELKNLLDNNLIEIMYGNNSLQGGITRCKANILKLIANKTDYQIKGYIAEFFIHLNLRLKGYKQECLLKNLEENNFKKGFDGVYTLNNEVWFAESKSGDNDRKKIIHKEKIINSIEDLNNKIAGKITNDPWMNAANHAKILSSCNNDLVQILEQFSYEYDQNIEHNINDFNTIYASTIFYHKTSHECDEQVKKQIIEIISRIQGLQSEVVCVNYRIFDDFIAYLKESK